MAADKKTIGVTPSNAAILTQLTSEGKFASELDGAKFAMAWAIRMGMPAGTTEGAETKWNVGSADPDGSLRSMLEALYPAVEEPYRLLEHLINEGLRGLPSPDGRLPHLYDLLFSEEEEVKDHSREPPM